MDKKIIKIFVIVTTLIWIILINYIFFSSIFPFPFSQNKYILLETYYGAISNKFIVDENENYYFSRRLTGLIEKYNSEGKFIGFIDNYITYGEIELIGIDNDGNIIFYSVREDEYLMLNIKTDEIKKINLIDHYIKYKYDKNGYFINNAKIYYNKGKIIKISNNKKTIVLRKKIKIYKLSKEFFIFEIIVSFIFPLLNILFLYILIYFSKKNRNKQ